MHPTSERLRVGWLLGANTGFVDGYTFYHYDERFASMQTGNLIQGGIAIAQRQWDLVGHFALPVICFAFGAGFGWWLKTIWPERTFGWQQHNLFIQIIGLATIALIGRLYLSESLFVGSIAFFMALQANSFTKLRGMTYATVMSTGNVRTFGENLIAALFYRDWSRLSVALTFALMISSFVVGAATSIFTTQIFGPISLIGSTLILSTVFIILNQKNDK